MKQDQQQLIQYVFNNRYLFKRILGYCKVDNNTLFPLLQLNNNCNSLSSPFTHRAIRKESSSSSVTSSYGGDGFNYTKRYGYDDWFVLGAIVASRHFGLITDRIKMNRLMFVDEAGIVEFIQSFANQLDTSLFGVVYSRYNSKFVGDSVLAAACQSGVMDIVRVLRNQVRPCKLSTARCLVNAAQFGHIPVIEYLASTGVVPSNPEEAALLFAVAINYHQDTRVVQCISRLFRLPPSKCLTTLKLEATCLINGLPSDISLILQLPGVARELVTSYIIKHRHHHTYTQQLAITQQLLSYEKEYNSIKSHQLDLPLELINQLDNNLIDMLSFHKLIYTYPTHNYNNQQNKDTMLFDDCLSSNNLPLIIHFSKILDGDMIMNRLCRKGSLEHFKAIQSSTTSTPPPIYQFHLNQLISRSLVEFTKYLYKLIDNNNNSLNQPPIGPIDTPLTLEIVKFVTLEMDMDENGQPQGYKRLIPILKFLSLECQEYVQSFLPPMTLDEKIRLACIGNDIVYIDQVLSDPTIDITSAIDMDAVVMNGSMEMVRHLLVHYNQSIRSRIGWIIAGETGSIEYLQLIEQYSTIKHYAATMSAASILGRLNIIEYVCNSVDKAYNMININSAIRYCHTNVIQYYLSLSSSNSRNRPPSEQECLLTAAVNYSNVDSLKFLISIFLNNPTDKNNKSTNHNHNLTHQRIIDKHAKQLISKLTPSLRKRYSNNEMSLYLYGIGIRPTSSHIRVTAFSLYRPLKRILLRLSEKVK